MDQAEQLRELVKTIESEKTWAGVNSKYARITAVTSG